jgi:predicted transcriptional regulator
MSEKWEIELQDDLAKAVEDAASEKRMTKERFAEMAIDVFMKAWPLIYEREKKGLGKRGGLGKS